MLASSNLLKVLIFNFKCILSETKGLETNSWLSLWNLRFKNIDLVWLVSILQMWKFNPKEENWSFPDYTLVSVFFSSLQTCITTSMTGMKKHWILLGLAGRALQSQMVGQNLFLQTPGYASLLLLYSLFSSLHFFPFGLCCRQLENSCLLKKLFTVRISNCYSGPV